MGTADKDMRIKVLIQNNVYKEETRSSYFEYAQVDFLLPYR